MPAQRLKRFLEENRIPYISIPHDSTFTAQETAASAHVRGQELAKTVMVRLDDRIVMAVLPSTAMLDLESLRKATGTKHAMLATEQQFQDRFPDCEVGAMPPFGNLYDLPVYVDSSLREDEHIAFNAGRHNELVQISYADFERLVRPKIVTLVYGAHTHA